jgi:hypothetical protein
MTRISGNSPADFTNVSEVPSGETVSERNVCEMQGGARKIQRGVPR